MNRLTLWSAQALPLDAFVAFLFDTQVAMSAIDWSLEAMCVGTRAGRERLVDANVLLEELEIHASTLDDSFRRFAPDHLAKLSNDRDGELRAEVFARRWDARDAATGAEVVPALVELEVHGDADEAHPPVAADYVKWFASERMPALRTLEFSINEEELYLEACRALLASKLLTQLTHLTLEFIDNAIADLILETPGPLRHLKKLKLGTLQRGDVTASRLTRLKKALPKLARS